MLCGLTTGLLLYVSSAKTHYVAYTCDLYEHLPLVCTAVTPKHWSYFLLPALALVHVNQFNTANPCGI